MTGDGQVLKDATFDAMEVGEELGPIELVVDDHAIKQFAFTVDDHHPWFLGGESPFSERVAHAAILVPWLLRLLNTRYDPNTEVGLHQKEEIWFDSPVKLGERVIMTGSFTDKYVKRDKGYIVTDAEARSLDDGRLLVRHRSIEIARVDPNVKLGGGSGERSAAARYVSGEWPADREPAERVTRATTLGTPFLGPVKTVHQDQMSVFSNVQAGWRNIHTDVEVARRAGSDRTIAQGLMQSMYISELGTRLFGRSWHESGWTLHTFLHPVYAGDTLIAKAVVVDHPGPPERDRVELEVWLENQDGVKVIVGWMSAIAVD
jgi:acyl dehydratase